MIRTLGGRRNRALIPPVVSPRMGAAVEPATASRALDELASQGNQGNRLAEETGVRIVDVHLVVGANTVPHPLGRAPFSVVVTPHVASPPVTAGWDPARPGNPSPTVETTVILTARNVLTEPVNLGSTLGVAGLLTAAGGVAAGVGQHIATGDAGSINTATGF